MIYLYQLNLIRMEEHERTPISYYQTLPRISDKQLRRIGRVEHTV